MCCCNGNRQFGNSEKRNNFCLLCYENSRRKAEMVAAIGPHGVLDDASRLLFQWPGRSNCNLRTPLENYRIILSLFYPFCVMCFSLIITVLIMKITLNKSIQIKSNQIKSIIYFLFKITHSFHLFTFQRKCSTFSISNFI